MDRCQVCECFQNARDLIFKFFGINIKYLLNVGVNAFVETDKLKAKLTKLVLLV